MYGPNPTPCGGGYGGGRGDGKSFWSDPRTQALLIVVGVLVVACAAALYF